MKTRCYCSRTAVITLLAATVGLGIAIWPATGTGQPSVRRSRPGSTTRSVDPNAGGPGSQWTKYEIILRRNIFSRTRRAYVSPDPNQAGRTVAVPNPESYLVLKGIVQENDEFSAFIEDTRTGEVLRLRRNDSVARGTIVSLSLDTIEYRCEDRTITIQMGRDLEGRRGAVVSYDDSDYWPSTPAPTASPAGTGQPQAPAGDEAAILKRLMEQRKQQLGQ